MKLSYVDGLQFLSIPDERLRQLIWKVFNDQELILNRHLYLEDDTKLEKTMKDKDSCYLVCDAIADWGKYYNDIDDVLANIDEDFFEEPAELDYAKITLSKFSKEMVKLEAAYTKQVIADFDNGEISFHDLSYYLNIEKPILCVNNGDQVKYAGRVIKTSMHTSMFSGKYLQIRMSVYSNIEKKKFSHVETRFNVPMYTGKQSLTSAGIESLTDEVRTMLIERGKRYVNLTSQPSYVSYTGNIVRRSWCGDRKFRATGRIMVDKSAMNTIDPDYDYYFATSSDDDVSRLPNTIIENITEEQYLCCSPYVYGFSFMAKQWGEFNIDTISDITFRTDSYDRLVMNSNIKEMLIALVDESHIAGKDFIDNKGGGTIFLLAGSPGLGKTLTAETISERLQRPLYSVGVGELGTSVDELETNLRNILDVATTWNAVVLLDEADIFMEERSDIHIEKNAMTGVFLRMLEYYQGTLFLTTNRDKTIDPAFYSRISLAIRYPELDGTSREHIWVNVLNLYDIELEPGDVKQLASYHINGRQIKNIIRIVVALAKRENRSPTLSDFIKVVDYTLDF